MSGSSEGPARRPAPPAVAEDHRARMDTLRQRIDALDEQLVSLLNARASCALEIGHVKSELGLEIYQPERESQVLAHVRACNTGPLGAEAVTRLFERIIDEARRLERIAKAE
jgi:chorismate mutase-like protein